MRTRRLPSLKLFLGLLALVVGFAGLGKPSAVAQPGGGEEMLRVITGKSLVINSPQPLERVVVSNPNTAAAVVISPNQVVIHGLEPGTTSLILWDEEGRPQPFELRVEVDAASLRRMISQVFPAEEIEVSQSGGSIVLSGKVASQSVADQALALAQTQAESVVNALALKGSSSQAVLLKIRFAEVDRAAVQELGLNLFSTGAGNTFGSATTQQFGSLGANVGAIPAEIEGSGQVSLPNIASGAIGNPLSGMPGVFGLSDLANIFLFRSDVNLGLTIEALQQRNLLEILAEPNVLALDGREASFLAGGEFPFPVIQGGGNFQAVTIVFKEFGVRLTFSPVIREDGMIFLKVAPEVSALDFANALTVEGFVIPALSTRRAETEIALRDGQSFAIAGLIDNRLTEVVSKVPGLGDIPFLGKLFRSRAKERTQTELLVTVSPKLVNPADPRDAQQEPEFPVPLRDEDLTEFEEESTPSR